MAFLGLAGENFNFICFEGVSLDPMILGEAILLTMKADNNLSMLNLKRVSMISVAGAFIALGAMSLDVSENSCKFVRE